MYSNIKKFNNDEFRSHGPSLNTSKLETKLYYNSPQTIMVCKHFKNIKFCSKIYIYLNNNNKNKQILILI